MSLLRRIPLLLAVLLAACQVSSTAGRGGRPALRDLHDIAELKEAFNADAGKPRLILLLSPT